MTHVLFVTPYYPPEKTAPAIRISETAQCLVRRGYEVTVLTTFPNFPTGIVAPEYCGRLIRREEREGVRIVRVWSYITPNKGFLKRILAQLSFGCVAPLLGWREVGRPDVIIVESPPLFNAIAGRLLARGKRCPFIFTVADLWPASAVQLGVLRNAFFIRLAEWLEWTTYRRAGLVWAVTEDIRKILVKRGMSPRRVMLLTNGVDTGKFYPTPMAQAREALVWEKRFTVLYAGTHGLAQGLKTVLDAARQLRAFQDIHFIFVGDGAEKASLQEKAQHENLTNVTFLDPQAHERMPLVLAGADVCLVPLRDIPLFRGALPSKMYEIMACARPIILAIDGEARQMLEQEAGAAVYVEPENAGALASAVLRLYEHPEVAEALGERGRTFVEAHFDREKLVEELEIHITGLLGRDASHFELTVERTPVVAGVEKSQV